MSDPKVPNTSDSESPTLAPQGNTKLESAPPMPDSSEAPPLVDGGRGPSDSDAATILAGPPQTRGPAASDAPTLIDAIRPSNPEPPRARWSALQLPTLRSGIMQGAG